MYKFLTAVMLVCSIWGIAQYRKEINAYERQIADLEYIIRTGHHCVSVCAEEFEKMGC